LAGRTPNNDKEINGASRKITKVLVTAVATGVAAWATHKMMPGGSAPQKVVDYSGQLTRDRGNATRSLRQALNTNSAVERPHHIIPWEAGHDPVTRPLLEAAGRGGFNINGANNGVNLNLQVHPQGDRHPRYNEAVMRQLRDLAKRNVTDAEAAAEIQAIADRLRPGLQRLNQSGQLLK
jgi:hypothetical protein